MIIENLHTASGHFYPALKYEGTKEQLKTSMRREDIVSFQYENREVILRSEEIVGWETDISKPFGENVYIFPTEDICSGWNFDPDFDPDFFFKDKN